MTPSLNIFDGPTRDVASCGPPPVLEQFLPPREATDWHRDLLEAIRRPLEPCRIPGRTDNDYIVPPAGGQSTLNTPTFEVQSYFKKPTWAVDQDPAPCDTVLAEMDVDVTSTHSWAESSLDFHTRWEQEWGDLDSPEVMRGVPLRDVEGGGNFDDVYLEAVGFAEPDRQDGPAYEDPDSLPLCEQVGLKEFTAVEDQLVHLEAVVEVKLESQDVLDWLDNDSIQADTVIPGECELVVKYQEQQQEEYITQTLCHQVAEQVEIPTTVDTSQLFADYLAPPLNSSEFDPASSTSCFGPIRHRRGRHSTADSSVTGPYHYSPTPSPGVEWNRRYPAAVSSETVAASKRKRGRPPIPPGRLIAPPVPRQRRLSCADSGLSDVSISSQDFQDQRYRRMRDLNNEASKRCRENRKLKVASVDTEVELQTERNRVNREKLRVLEALVARMKAVIMDTLRPPTLPRDGPAPTN